MKLWTKMLLAASGGSAAYYHYRKNARAEAPTADDLHDVATRSGIADVDPEPLSQVVEAQDPDATAAAHEELRDLHDRLPR